MAKKESEDMRNQLKNIITLTRGMSAWEELLRTEGDIRKKRQKLIYDQQERQRKVIEILQLNFNITDWWCSHWTYIIIHGYKRTDLKLSCDCST